MNDHNTMTAKNKRFKRALICVAVLLAMGGGFSFWVYYKNYLSPDVKMIAAISAGDVPGFHNALHSGANPNFVDEILDTPLTIACCRDNYGMAKELLERGANPNVAGDGGYTPLMYACQSMDIALVKLLLGRGAKTDPKNNKGLTALDIAIQHKQADIANILR
jgi:ankyrin repeat protein